MSVADNAGRIAACGFADATASASRSRTRQTPVDFPRRTRTINTLATDNGQLTTDKPAKRRAFTLIEIMVVVVIILLMLGMAVPVFRVINGSRSEAGAANVISAMLNRARTDAIGIQQPYGVAFVVNPSTGQAVMAEVDLAQCQTWTTTGVGPVPSQGCVSMTNTTGTYYLINNTNAGASISGPPPTSGAPSPAPANFAELYGPPLELAADTDAIPLPVGIGVQTICNCSMSGTSRTSNGYLSVGVILFDGKGRIVSLPYGISIWSKLANATGIGISTNPSASDYPSVVNAGSPPGAGVQSQFGLVVYQNDAYQSHRSSISPEVVYSEAGPSLNSNGTSPGYGDYSSKGSPTQLQADLWLDQNATPLLIDRYTGTLIRAE